MVRLPHQDISAACKEALDAYQAEIDTVPDYLAQVDQAKALWPLRKMKPVFTEVKEKLVNMCAGARRCHYCEDSMADEIEHFRPKNIYPGQTFVWENYLYSCGPCNGPKGDRFALFEAETGNRVDLTPPRKKKSEKNPPRQAPPDGLPLLINPREEDPLDYIFLDILSGSFAFEPWETDPNTPAYQRAAYTIEVLRLNARDDLVQARRLAYSNYTARLAQYIFSHAQQAPQHELSSMIDQIQKEAHPSVWQEMKQDRTRRHIPALDNLFRQAPQALTW